MISGSYVEIHAGKCCSFQRIRSVHYFVKMADLVRKKEKEYRMQLNYDRRHKAGTEADELSPAPSPESRRKSRRASSRSEIVYYIYNHGTG